MLLCSCKMGINITGFTSIHLIINQEVMLIKCNGCIRCQTVIHAARHRAGPVSDNIVLCFSAAGTEGTIVSPVGPDELPPPYTPSSSGVPMVTCRVCQAMIDISGKVDQHVVKCNQCNEATVRVRVMLRSGVSIKSFECFLFDVYKVWEVFCVSGIAFYFVDYQKFILDIFLSANQECSTRKKICPLPLQLSANL